MPEEEGVEPEILELAPARCALFAQVEAAGPASVTGVPAQEDPKIQPMDVVDHGLLGVSDPPPLPLPAVTELPVLGHGEPGVESSALPEEFGREREVGRGEELAPPGVLVEEFVHGVEDDLAGGRIGTLRGAVQGPPPKRRFRLLAEARLQGLQPVRSRHAVAVGEAEILPLGHGRTGVPRHRRPSPRLPVDTQIQSRGTSGHRGRRGDGALVVDHDDLEAVAGILQAAERLQAREELPRPVKGGNDYGEQRAHDGPL
jgi:hypothetical protein